MCACMLLYHIKLGLLVNSSLEVEVGTRSHPGYLLSNQLIN